MPVVVVLLLLPVIEALIDARKADQLVATVAEYPRIGVKKDFFNSSRLWHFEPLGFPAKKLRDRRAPMSFDAPGFRLGAASDNP